MQVPAHQIDVPIYRFLAIVIGVSITTQLIGAIALTDPSLAWWFGGIAALLLIGGGVAALLQLRPSQWLMDGIAVILGICGGLIL